MKCKVNVVLANEFEGSPVVTFSPHADSTREKVSFWRTKRTKSCRRITRVLGSSTMQISSLFRLTVTITGNSLYILRIKSDGRFYDGLKKSVTKQRKVRETTTSPIIRKFLDSIYYFLFFSYLQYLLGTIRKKGKSNERRTQDIINLSNLYASVKSTKHSISASLLDIYLKTTRHDIETRNLDLLTFLTVSMSLKTILYLKLS